LFEKYGEIRNVHLVKDRDTGLPKGLGFVNFGEIGPAQAAIDELDGSDFGGRQLFMGFSMNR